MSEIFLERVQQQRLERAAFATMISQSFTEVVLTAYLFVREKLSNIFVQQAINGFGEDSIAAFTVYFRVEINSYHSIQAVATVYPITWALAACVFIGYYIYLAKKSRSESSS